MRIRPLLVAATLVAVAVSGCSGDDEPDADPSGAATSSPPPAATPDAPEVLGLGKSVLALDSGTTYRSPRGFEPEVTVEVKAAGWVSTHRGLDAFDLSQPVPDADAALVVYAFVVPPEASAEEALAAVRQRATDAGATVEQTGDFTVTITGGDGPLVSSRDGGIALDAVPSGYARVTATPGEPFLMVWWVPDSAHADDAEGLTSSLGVVYEFT